MFTARTRRALAGAAGVAVAALALAGCASSNPLEDDNAAGGETGGDDTTIVVGSQAYYSNEIIAEIYAQALENAGFEVEREFQIGQRDAYIPLLEDGSVNVFPEYSGNLLQYFDEDTEARTADDVYAALPDALPEGLAVLDQSTATDQDSYPVTADFAEQSDLTPNPNLAGCPYPQPLAGPPRIPDP